MLDARVHVGVAQDIGESPTPLDGTCCKDTRPTWSRVDGRVGERTEAATTAMHGRVGEYRQPRWRQPIIPHLVVLVAHDAWHRRAIHKASVGKHPARGARHHVGVVVVHLLLVHHPDDGILRQIHRRIAPVRGNDRIVHIPHRIRPRGRVVGGKILVGDLHAVGYPRRIGLEANLPVHAIGREEGHINPRIDGVLQVGAHGHGPVLVMAN